MLVRYPEGLLCILVFVVVVHTEDSGGEDKYNLKSVLQCLRREYTLKAIRSDNYGRKCWDYLRATSCWGRCDSYEIPDWRFPYKVSVHPVCIHDQKILRRVRLRNCDPPDTDDDGELRLYEYYDAVTCSCGSCNSSDAFCDWKDHIQSHHRPIRNRRNTMDLP